MILLDATTIEEWIFDYYEGNLSEDQEKFLMNYLAKHPEHEEDFVLWKQTYIQEPLPEKIAFEYELKRGGSNFGATKRMGYFLLLLFLASSSWFLYSGREDVTNVNGTQKLIKGQARAVQNTKQIEIPSSSSVSDFVQENKYKPFTHKRDVLKESTVKDVAMNKVHLQNQKMDFVSPAKIDSTSILPEKTKPDSNVTQTALDREEMLAPKLSDENNLSKELAKDTPELNIQKTSPQKSRRFQIRMKNVSVNE